MNFSGFLVSHIYFRVNAKGNLETLSQGVSKYTAAVFHFFGLIIYRFVRLTTPYMFVLGLVEVVMKYFHHHSVFETPADDHENCPKYWWRNVLYVNTLFPVDQMVNWEIQVYLSDSSNNYFQSNNFLVHALELVLGLWYSVLYCWSLYSDYCSQVSDLIDATIVKKLYSYFFFDCFLQKIQIGFDHADCTHGFIMDSDRIYCIRKQTRSKHWWPTRIIR